MIAGAGAAYASLVTYLIPPIALAYGAIFLDERFGATASAASRSFSAASCSAPACSPARRGAGWRRDVSIERAPRASRRRRLPARADHGRGHAAVSRRPRRRDARRGASPRSSAPTREPDAFGWFVIEVGRRARGLRRVPPRQRAQPHRRGRALRRSIRASAAADRHRGGARVPAASARRPRLPPRRAADLRLQRARDRARRALRLRARGREAEGVSEGRRVAGRGALLAAAGGAPGRVASGA